jgi:ethanolamine utilization protein EutN
MQLGQVVGHATSTVKHSTLTGWKLLIVQMLGVAEQSDGEPILAIDKLGAGLGQRVIVCNDGAGTRQMIGAKNSPARWFVLGLCDQ